MTFSPALTIARIVATLGIASMSRAVVADEWYDNHATYLSTVVQESDAKGTEIGTRRELFVDSTLVESISGEARRVLHHPTPRDIVLVNDQPWEGNGLNYVTVLKDGDTFRMYYRTGKYDVLNQFKSITPEVVCVALSKDGIHWTRPNLGLIEFGGSKHNNIIMIKDDMKWLAAPHHFSPFLDNNPNALKAERYKGTGGLPLRAWVSEDGFDWKLAKRKPVVLRSYFDSLNCALWDPHRKEYCIFSRTKRYAGRDILVSRSSRFAEDYGDPVTIEYTPSRGGQLYTNQIILYHRASHYYLGFPTRIEYRGVTPSTKYLPDWQFRQQREDASATLNNDPGDGAAATEGLFMASRDGKHFRLYEEAFARPGLRTRDTWFYGDMFQARGLLETPSDTFEDAPDELSLYFNEGCLRPNQPGKIRRYTLRLDGFVSIYATMPGGKVTTRRIQFAGDRLTLNYSSSIRGGIRVGFVTEIGQPVDGFALEQCPWIYGDQLERPVEWWRGEALTTDVSELAGRTLKIVFELKDADLYSYRFARD